MRQPGVTLGAAAAVLAMVTGCRKPERDGVGAPVASLAHLPGGDAASLASALGSVDLRVEAIRGASWTTEPLLVRHHLRISLRFGAAPAFPLMFQAASVGGGKVAVLLQATQGDPRPLVWLLDAHGEVLWSKDHPMGGVNPGASEAVIAPGPGGHVCLAWCNGSTHSIALRRWAEDGSSFADYDALHVDECAALSVLYWPGRGWVFGIAGENGATLELIDENGERKWGNDGMNLPWTWNGAAPVSLALDTEDSLLLFRLGRSGAPGSGEYVFASRWSADGRPMWPGPLSLKRLPAPVTDSRVRVLLQPASEGAIRATVPASGAAPVVVEVLSDGTITRR